MRFPFAIVAVLLIATASATVAASATADTVKGMAYSDPQVHEAARNAIRKSAAGYGSLQAFHARGRLFSGHRYRGQTAEENAGRLRVYYRAPDRLRIEIDGYGESVHFNADGTTVTQAWPGSKRYIQTPQPPDLAAFVEQVFPGERQVDHTGAIGSSLVAPLLLSSDPLAFLEANVVEFVSEGDSRVRGRDCHQVKLLQDDPECIFTKWIDKRTGLIWRTAVLYGLRDDGLSAGSYTNSAWGNMRMLELEEMTTSTSSVPASVFKYRIPRGWKEGQPDPDHDEVEEDEEAQAPARNPVSLAGILRTAAASYQESTVTLESISGSMGWSISRIVPTSGTVRCLAVPPLAHRASLGPLCVAMEDGSLQFRGNDGEVRRTIQGLPDAGKVEFAETTGGLVVVSADYLDNRVEARSLEGEVLWSSKAPSNVYDIAGFCSASPGAGSPVVATAGPDGLRLIDADGRTMFTNFLASHRYLVMVPDVAGLPDKILTIGYSKGLAYFGEDGTLHSKHSLDGSVLGIAVSSDELPRLYCVILQSDYDDEYSTVVCMNPDGTPQWTVGVPEDNPATYFVGFSLVRRAGEQRDLVLVHSTGAVSFTSRNGTPGGSLRVRPHGRALQGNPEDFVSDAAVVDMDGDGTDEICLATSAGLIILSRDAD